jgi:beta-xylosidase
MIKALLPLAAAVLAATAASASAQPVHLPVFQENFPDPFVVQQGGEFIAYSTNDGGANLPVATSRNLLDWAYLTDPQNPKKRRDGLPKLGAWAREGLTWAPEVMQVGNHWLLYYTARHRKADLQCIGVAAASDPRGPFVDSAPDALVCQRELGGSIDAHAFKDADGQLYLYYKNDGNAVRKPTELWAHRLSADGTALVGEPVSLNLRNDQPWEGNAIEAPTMVSRPGGYTLLYSANFFGWAPDQRLSAYAMGYALCSTPMGPCKDGPGNPVLYSYNERKAGCLSGPGHQAVFRAFGREFLAFHGWAATPGCRRSDDKRLLYIAPLFWENGKPLVGPSVRRKGS